MDVEFCKKNNLLFQNFKMELVLEIYSHLNFCVFLLIMKEVIFLLCFLRNFVLHKP
jgi:hypothetical protein